MPGGGGKGGSPSGYTNVTQTQNTAPWSAQQPYLQNLFGSAQNLYSNYQPQYYPGSTAAQTTPLQNLALNSVSGIANSLGPTDQNALSYLNSMLTPGQFFGNNPAVSPLENLAGTNVGTNNPGTSTLENLAGGNVSGYQVPQSALTQLGLNNAAYNNPAYGSLAGIANSGAQGVGTAGNLALGSIGPSEGVLASGLAPAESTLGSYASGSQTNPYLSAVAQSTLANVVPSIESQFINGGDLSSPQAAYATSQGASAALAPVINTAYQQEQQNQLNAANSLGNLGIQGANTLQNLSLNPASLYGNLSLANTGLQANTGTALGSQILQGQGLQQNALGQAAGNALNLGGLQSGAATSLGNQALQGAGLQTQQLSDIGNLYNTAGQIQNQALALYPQTQAAQFTPAQEEYNFGAQQQAQNQNQLNSMVNAWNYGQNLPYQLLNQFQGNIGGNYGGSSTGQTSSPYYINQGANVLSGLLGGTALGNALIPGGISGLFGGGGSDLASIFGSNALGAGLFAF